MSDRFLSITLCGLIVLVATSQTGCQTTGSKLASLKETSLPWEGKKEPRKGAPDRLVGTWTEAVRHNAEVGSERGFGGRLFFYDRQGTDPIRVEGQLVVYAFVEDGRITTDHRPTRRYVFPPQQFVKHESESEVGVSYSVWLPWDQEVTGEQVDVSLIARFEPLQGGGLVVGDQTRHRLPGRPRIEVARSPQPAASGSVQPAIATESTGNVVPAGGTADKGQPEVTATTIPLPPGFERHLSPPRQKPAISPTRPPAVQPPAAAAPSQPSVAPSATSQAILPQPANTMLPAAMQTDTLTGLGTQPAMYDPRFPGAQPGGASTTITLLTPGESARQATQRQSFGFQPPSHLVPAKPASPSEVAR